MINRREFLKLSGLTLAIVLKDGGFRVVKASQLRQNPHVWINISRDNYLSVYSNKSEMGQGVYTGLAMVVADELDFPWEKVKVVSALAGRDYVDPLFGIQLTGGSTSIRNMYGVLRSASAVMKEMLLQTASERLKLPRSSLKAELGYIHYPGGKISYGELAELAKDRDLPREFSLKKEKEFRYIGKGVPRIDMEDKVNGKAIFGIDVRVDGMVYATMIRPPSYGSKVSKVDDSRAKRIKGFIEYVPMETKVAVVAQDMWALLKAKDSIHIEWTKSPIQDLDDEKLKGVFLKAIKERGQVARREGNPEEVLKNAKLKTSSLYVLPYLYHAHLEPLSCVVDVRKDGCTIYAPVQAQTWVLESAKRITGLPENRIYVYTPYLGGGFGRKANVEFVEEALTISKRLGRPVKLIYTREEDLKTAHFRPMSVTLMEGAVENGKVVAVRHKIAIHPIRGSRGSSLEGIENTLYSFPNFSVEYVPVNMPFPTWFWRSVGHSHNAFVMETFIDELAQLAKRDPVELRLELLNNERAKKVVQVCAEMSGWGKKGKAMGLAYHFSFGTHCAQAVEVSLEKDGRIKVNRVVCVMDIGPFPIHPDLARQQVEGAIIMGMSAALKERVSFRSGGPSTLNFDTYPILTLEEAPEDIEVYFVKSKGAMGGVGEPPLPPIAPAIANALLWGYGIKIRELPMTPERIRSIVNT